MARKRALGPALSAGEVERYLALLDDRRTAPDPDDPPSYDWTGGAPLAGGSQMQVCDQAAQTLRKCGGEALTAALHARLQSAQIVPEREAVIQLAFDLLGCRHPFVLARLYEENEENRAAVLRAFAPLAWRNHENLDLLAPFLASKKAAEARQACHLMQLTATWLKPQAAGKLPASLLDDTVQQLQKAPPEDEPLRMDCVGYAAFLTGGWDTLARTLSQRPAQDTARVVNLPCFTASHAAPLLQAHPALRDVFRTAIYARFSAARPGSRYHELPLVCCFAPDPQALDLGMSELAVRASAGMEMAVFAKHDPGLMPRLLDAALPCVRRQQADAHGIKSLFLAHPQAFAQTLLSKPATQVETIEKVREVLRQLPSRTEADALMARITGEIERITAHSRKKKSQALAP